VLGYYVVTKTVLLVLWKAQKKQASKKLGLIDEKGIAAATEEEQGISSGGVCNAENKEVTEEKKEGLQPRGGRKNHQIAVVIMALHIVIVDNKPEQREEVNSFFLSKTPDELLCLP